MVKGKDGLNILKSILSVLKVDIYNYYIYVKGYFDKVGYKKYIKIEYVYDIDVKDKFMFFRVCLFVKLGVGCMLFKRYRSYVCNFFICDEIIKKIEKYDEFKNYINECNNYVRWIEWENYLFEIFLIEKKLNLKNGFDEIVNIFRDMLLREYKFKNLDLIVILDEVYNDLNKKLG